MEIKLSGFCSIYEIIVAFTFAYNGIKSFKEWVDSLVSKDIDEDLKALKIKILVFAENKKFFHSNVKKSEESLAEELGKRQLEENRKKITDQTTNLSANCENTSNGKIFYSQFILTGFYYISVLMIAGFQDILKDLTSFILLFLNTSICIGILLYNICHIRKACKNPDFGVLKFNPLLYILLYSVLILIIVISVKLGENKLTVFINEYMPTNFIDWAKLFILLFSFIPVFIPFLNFFLYHNLYGKNIKNSLKSILDGENMKLADKDYKSDIDKMISNIIN